MANLETTLKIVFDKEFNNNPDLFLHHNQGETGLTLGGIYQNAHPHDINWEFIKSLIVLCGTDMKRASRMLYFDTHTMNDVRDIFKRYYWDVLKLDKIVSQKIASELMLLGVLAGNTTAIKVAQRVVNVTVDGIIGNQTLTALNQFNENRFDVEFDDEEIKQFEAIVASNPDKYARYLDGWKNRAVSV